MNYFWPKHPLSAVLYNLGVYDENPIFWFLIWMWYFDLQPIFLNFDLNGVLSTFDPPFFEFWIYRFSEIRSESLIKRAKNDVFSPLGCFWKKIFLQCLRCHKNVKTGPFSSISAPLFIISGGFKAKSWSHISLSHPFPNRTMVYIYVWVYKCMLVFMCVHHWCKQFIFQDFFRLRLFC